MTLVNLLNIQFTEKLLDPNIHLIIMAIGMFIVLVGILRLAHHGDDVEAEQTSNEPELSNVFHYFLQEEEKKNNDMRAMLIRQADSTRVDGLTKMSRTQEPTGQVVQTMPAYEQTIRHEMIREQNPIRQANPMRQAESKFSVQNREVMTIIDHYQKGESVEHIAKRLGKGVGEVKLVLSLYATQNQ